MITTNILDKIIRYKLEDVREQKELVPVKLLEKSVFYKTEAVSLKEYVLREDKLGIIAEIKRQSPSGGVINSNISIERISIGYMQAGASALSVLTDTRFFGGSNEDLITARKFNYCPILRKDFIVDTYQIIEAKSGNFIDGNATHHVSSDECCHLACVINTICQVGQNIPCLLFAEFHK